MGLAEIADFVFGPILNPLLKLEPVLTILAVALLISVISVLAQKHFTNQDRLKFLKKETKRIQAEVKKHKDNPEKQLKLNKKMMPLQGEMMKESLKPTLWMMLPFLLVFLWLSGHMAYEPLLPGETFSVEAQTTANTVLLDPIPEGVTLTTPANASVVDGVARWELVADAGYYTLILLTDRDEESVPVLVTSERAFEPPVQSFSGDITLVTLGNQKLKPMDPFTLFGWRPGWIATYIIFSLILSIGLRKWLDVA